MNEVDTSGNYWEGDPAGLGESRGPMVTGNSIGKAPSFFLGGGGIGLSINVRTLAPCPLPQR